MDSGSDMEETHLHRLFETKPVKGRILFRLYAASVFLGICFIFTYRISFFPKKNTKIEIWSWIGLSLAESWFCFYWLLTVVVRWNPILSERYGENLPSVDIFVCTADPRAEPPSMVINTVLSLMAYDYPPSKLNVYLSDDGGSELSFYGMVEASRFCKIWLPFCRKFKVEPRAPQAYFGSVDEPVGEVDPVRSKEWLFVKKSFEEMMMRIEATTKLGKIPNHIRQQHKGFREYDVVSDRNNHQTILQIIIDGRDPEAVDDEGEKLPTLVYLAREKRPNYHHNFKAGAMNALIRVSSKISNSPIILNVDCDMYSNNSQSVKGALCFFMDRTDGHGIGFVQLPQGCHNLGKNDLYANAFRVEHEVELAGIDGNGGVPYIGTGCFHRRDAISGKNYNKHLESNPQTQITETTDVLERTSKVLASCTYEENTEWGKDLGLKYGFAVEDVISGLSVQCKGWRSVYMNPERKGFAGFGATALISALVQQKRWSEGHLQIFLSRFSPLLFGHNKISLKHRLSYCPYNLWAVNSVPTLYFALVPSLCLLKGISLFPKVSSPWVVPFIYVTFAASAYNLGEFLWYGGTFKGWLNLQRIWLFRRITSYLFGFSDAILKLFGFSELSFALTAKVADDEDASRRYEQEMMEFGASSPMFCIIATIALLNLFTLVGSILVLNGPLASGRWDLSSKLIGLLIKNMDVDRMGLQIVLCWLLVAINFPVYRALFVRRDNGRIPPSTAAQAMVFALLACAIAMY